MRNRLTSMLVLLAATAAHAGPRDYDDSVRKLADAEPAVREATRRDLMGLTPADLPDLARAATAARPLRLTQLLTLRSVATYVLTRASVIRLPTQGDAFLGVQLAYPDVPTDDNEETPDGVAVLGTVPGFAAMRFLDEGDLIVSLDAGTRPIRVTSRRQLINYVKGLRLGTKLIVTARRAGRLFTCTIPLDPRPRIAGVTPVEEGQTIDSLVTQAETAAEKAAAELFADSEVVVAD